MNKFKMYNIILAIAMVILLVFWLSSGSSLTGSLFAIAIFYLIGFYIIYRKYKNPITYLTSENTNFNFDDGWVSGSYLKTRNASNDYCQSDLKKYSNECAKNLDKSMLYNGLSNKEIIEQLNENEKIFQLPPNCTDKCPITLIREKNNRVDSKAVKIVRNTQDGKELSLGYIPREYAHDSRFRITKIKKIKATLYGGNYKKVMINENNEKEVVLMHTPISLYLNITFE